MAITVSNARNLVLGNIKAWTAKVTGDGSSTTLMVPLKTIIGVWTGNINDVGGVPMTSFSGNTITYSAAIGNNESHSLFVLGV